MNWIVVGMYCKLEEVCIVVQYRALAALLAFRRMFQTRPVASCLLACMNIHRLISENYNWARMHISHNDQDLRIIEK